jgi:hypothetical protein
MMVDLHSSIFTPQKEKEGRKMASNGFGDPSEDVYKYEELQEKRAMLKNIHLPMKSWFGALDKAFTEKFGRYPPFWQDLEGWEHVKVVQKLYLAATETGDPGVNIFKLEAKLFPVAPEEGQGQGGQQQQGSGDGEIGETETSGGVVVKKRRNRWGSSEQEQKETEGQEEGQEGQEEEASEESVPKKRRSRFSTAAAAPAAAPSTVSAAESAPPSAAAGLAAAAGEE